MTAEFGGSDVRDDALAQLLQKKTSTMTHPARDSRDSYREWDTPRWCYLTRPTIVESAKEKKNKISKVIKLMSKRGTGTFMRPIRDRSSALVTHCEFNC